MQNSKNLASDLEKHKNKRTILDFHNSNITGKNLHKVLNALQKAQESLQEKSTPLIIRLAENNLQENDVILLCSRILENKHLCANLESFELANNLLQDGILPSLKQILERCPKLQLLDVAINYINSETVEKVFHDVAPSILKKFKYNPY